MHRKDVTTIGLQRALDVWSGLVETMIQSEANDDLQYISFLYAIGFERTKSVG